MLALLERPVGFVDFREKSIGGFGSGFDVCEIKSVGAWQGFGIDALAANDEHVFVGLGGSQSLGELSKHLGPFKHRVLAA